MHPQALAMIESSLAPLIKKGADIDRLSLIVCPGSQIAEMQMVETRYGFLVVLPGEFVPKGVSYLIEDQGRAGRAFAWVSVPKDYPKMEEKKHGKRTN